MSAFVPGNKKLNEIWPLHPYPGGLAWRQAHTSLVCETTERRVRRSRRCERPVTHVRCCGSCPVARGQGTDSTGTRVAGSGTVLVQAVITDATHWAAFKKQIHFHTPGGRKSELGLPAGSG